MSVVADGLKKKLNYRELRQVVELCLWAGQLLLQSGANSRRIEETIHRLGTGLGCDWLDILIGMNEISITASEGQEFRTKSRRVVRLGVNMGKLSAINDLSRQTVNDGLSLSQVERRLKQIDQMPATYNQWLVIGMAGLACAAFSRLFGGDWTIFGVTFGAASAAMLARLTLSKRRFNTILITALCAFVAAILAGYGSAAFDSSLTVTAFAAAVLLLVPGVHLINAAHDLIAGYVNAGIQRGMIGFLFSLAIALGLALAMRLMGFSDL